MHNNNNGYPSSTRAWMTVAILMLAYVLSFVDRQILNLLVEPIRRDLDITDTHMSLLMGFSFAVFYTICGVPIGRLADRKSRRGIIAIGVLVWSLMTALCGTAKTFWHFLVFRIGVGVGEAALSPSAYSLIADSFPPKLRGTAMSVYSMGIYIGSGLAFLLGGLVVKFASAQGDVELPVLGMVRPWQLIFLVLGAAGVLFAAYTRQNRRTVLCHNFGFACLAFAAYGSSAWIPTFFIRTYGWSASDVGVLYGSVVAVAGSIGIIAGGRLSDLLHRRGYRDAPLRVGIISAALTLPLNLAYLAGTGELALALIALHVFTIAMPFGVGPAAIQEIMPNSMRGQASAVYLFVITMVGLGIGPTAVALGTDFVFGDDNALRYSLLIVTGVALVGAIVLLGMGLKHYRGSLDRLQEWKPQSAAGSDAQPKPV